MCVRVQECNWILGVDLDKYACVQAHELSIYIYILFKYNQVLHSASYKFIHGCK